MRDATDTTETWLTQEAYDRLQAELDQLTGPGRLEIAKKIEAARAEGDLRENGGYHAAKEEQGKQEARIRQLTSLLRQAKVGTAPAEDGVAGPGMVVTVRFAGAEESETFLIGSREEAGLSEIEVYSAQSPLGKALLGARGGDTVEYTTPSGRTMQVSVVEVAPYLRA
ncbi:MAG: transcription elongation factor GreA [Mycobacteriales bacterium]